MGVFWSRLWGVPVEKAEVQDFTPLQTYVTLLTGVDYITPSLYQQYFDAQGQCTIEPVFTHVGSAHKYSTQRYMMLVYHISENRPFEQGRTYREAWNTQIRVLQKIARADIGPGIVEAGLLITPTLQRKRLLFCFRWEGTLLDYLERFVGILTVEKVAQLAQAIQLLLERLHSLGIAHGSFRLDCVLYRMTSTNACPQLCLCQFEEAVFEGGFGLFGIPYADVICEEQTQAACLTPRLCHILITRYNSQLL